MKKFIESAKEFAGGMGKRKLTVYAASGCYYIFMALVPIVMILCCLLPYTPFNQSMILGLIDEYFSESLGDIMRRIVSAIYTSNAATLTVSIVLTLYSASASMKALMKGVDAAYDFERKENIIVFSVRALIYMLVLVVSILLSLCVMVYGGKIIDLILYYLPNLTVLENFQSILRYLIIMAFLFLVFMLLYKWMPAKKVEWKDQIPGAVFSAVVWVIFSGIFTWYVNISDKYGAYGFIGTIMVAMMWMYYILYFLLIGGYINSWFTGVKARRRAASAE